LNYCKSGKKPADIPADPHGVYKESGWAGMGDWLGTGSVSNRLRKFRSFKEARAFVHHLGLKSEEEWRDYLRSGKKPADIPSNPRSAYADDGWAGLGEWLGTGRIRGTGWQSFKTARAFVHRLGLKSQREWQDYCKSGKKPIDVPYDPRSVYNGGGWAGFGDWLGTGRIADQLREYRSFKNARAFVHRLGLKSQEEWRDYLRSGKKPADIPSNPGRHYADDGWVGMGDWLGTGYIAARLREYRSFENARAFVRRLGLNSRTEWTDYCKSGKKPADIPSKPSEKYAEAGWSNWGDWLGSTGSRRGREWQPFNRARAFVRGLGLKSTSEWYEYCQSVKKPPDIPSNPDKTYAEAGWAGYSDWLRYQSRGRQPL
jgi:Phage-integrase repeat unit